jgi:hypothetical protein
MEKRLGRSISSAAWNVAVKQRYVATALEEVDRLTAEVELAAFLSDLLLVRDEALRSQVAVRRGTASPQAPTSPYLGARIQAVSRLAAEHAAGDGEILAFRRLVLGRDTPLSSDAAEAYLDLPEARGDGQYEPSTARPLEVIDYQNARFSYRLHVWQGSPLDRLRRLASALSESYPWQASQAAAFVLEGQIPLATALWLHFPQPLHEERPRRAKLVIEVDLWMPAGDVLRAYRKVQRQVLPGHNKPVSLRSIELVNFVFRHRRAKWRELLELWNSEHPDDGYSSYRHMRFAFQRARGSLLFPRYRTYLGT